MRSSDRRYSQLAWLDIQDPRNASAFEADIGIEPLEGARLTFGILLANYLSFAMALTCNRRPDIQVFKGLRWPWGCIPLGAFASCEKQKPTATQRSEDLFQRHRAK